MLLDTAQPDAIVPIITPTCGGGQFARNSLCYNDSKCITNVVDQSIQSYPCNTQPCNLDYFQLGPWSECQSNGGTCTQGDSFRNLTCLSQPEQQQDNQQSSLARRKALQKIDLQGHRTTLFTQKLDQGVKNTFSLKQMGKESVSGGTFNFNLISKAGVASNTASTKPTSQCRPLNIGQSLNQQQVCTFADCPNNQTCSPGVCLNGGQCVRNDNNSDQALGSGQLCSCSAGYTGLFCEQSLSNCSNGVLMESGQCCQTFINNKGYCCPPNQIIDTNGDCCRPQDMNRCGVCQQGASIDPQRQQRIDAYGQCTSNVLDSSGRQCQSGYVDECGVCDGDNTSCDFLLNFQSEILSPAQIQQSQIQMQQTRNIIQIDRFILPNIFYQQQASQQQQRQQQQPRRAQKGYDIYKRNIYSNAINPAEQAISHLGEMPSAQGQSEIPTHFQEFGEQIQDVANLEQSQYVPYSIWKTSIQLKHRASNKEDLDSSLINQGNGLGNAHRQLQQGANGQNPLNQSQLQSSSVLQTALAQLLWRQTHIDGTSLFYFQGFTNQSNQIPDLVDQLINNTALTQNFQNKFQVILEGGTSLNLSFVNFPLAYEVLTLQYLKQNLAPYYLLQQNDPGFTRKNGRVTSLERIPRCGNSFCEHGEIPVQTFFNQTTIQLPTSATTSNSYYHKLYDIYNYDSQQYSSLGGQVYCPSDCGYMQFQSCPLGSFNEAQTNATCSQNGQCNTLGGYCLCYYGYTGDSCERCAYGFQQIGSKCYKLSADKLDKLEKVFQGNFVQPSPINSPAPTNTSSPNVSPSNTTQGSGSTNMPTPSTADLNSPKTEPNGHDTANQDQNLPPNTYRPITNNNNLNIGPGDGRVPGSSDASSVPAPSIDDLTLQRKLRLIIGLSIGCGLLLLLIIVALILLILTRCCQRNLVGGYRTNKNDNRRDSFLEKLNKKSSQSVQGNPSIINNDGSDSKDQQHRQKVGFLGQFYNKRPTNKRVKSQSSPNTQVPNESTQENTKSKSQSLSNQFSVAKSGANKSHTEPSKLRIPEVYMNQHGASQTRVNTAQTSAKTISNAQRVLQEQLQHLQDTIHMMDTEDLNSTQKRQELSVEDTAKLQQLNPASSSQIVNQRPSSSEQHANPHENLLPGDYKDNQSLNPVYGQSRLNLGSQGLRSQKATWDFLNLRTSSNQQGHPSRRIYLRTNRTALSKITSNSNMSRALQSASSKVKDARNNLTTVGSLFKEYQYFERLRESGSSPVKGTNDSDDNNKATGSNSNHVSSRRAIYYGGKKFQGDRIQLSARQPHHYHSSQESGSLGKGGSTSDRNKSVSLSNEGHSIQEFRHHRYHRHSTPTLNSGITRAQHTDTQHSGGTSIKNPPSMQNNLPNSQKNKAPSRNNITHGIQGLAQNSALNPYIVNPAKANENSGAPFISPGTIQNQSRQPIQTSQGPVTSNRDFVSTVNQICSTAFWQVSENQSGHVQNQSSNLIKYSSSPSPSNPNWPLIPMVANSQAHSKRLNKYHHYGNSISVSNNSNNNYNNSNNNRIISNEANLVPWDENPDVDENKAEASKGLSSNRSVQGAGSQQMGNLIGNHNEVPMRISTNFTPVSQQDLNVIKSKGNLKMTQTQSKINTKENQVTPIKDIVPSQSSQQVCIENKLADIFSAHNDPQKISKQEQQQMPAISNAQNEYQIKQPQEGQINNSSKNRSRNNSSAYQNSSQVSINKSGQQTQDLKEKDSNGISEETLNQLCNHNPQNLVKDNTAQRDNPIPRTPEKQKITQQNLNQQMPDLLVFNDSGTTIQQDDDNDDEVQPKDPKSSQHSHHTQYLTPQGKGLDPKKDEKSQDQNQQSEDPEQDSPEIKAESSRQSSFDFDDDQLGSVMIERSHDIIIKRGSKDYLIIRSESGSQPLNADKSMLLENSVLSQLRDQLRKQQGQTLNSEQLHRNFKQGVQESMDYNKVTPHPQQHVHPLQSARDADRFVSTQWYNAWPQTNQLQTPQGPGMNRSYSNRQIHNNMIYDRYGTYFNGQRPLPRSYSLPFMDYDSIQHFPNYPPLQFEKYNSDTFTNLHRAYWLNEQQYLDYSRGPFKASRQSYPINQEPSSQYQRSSRYENRQESFSQLLQIVDDLQQTGQEGYQPQHQHNYSHQMPQQTVDASDQTSIDLRAHTENIPQLHLGNGLLGQDIKENIRDAQNYTYQPCLQGNDELQSYVSEGIFDPMIQVQPDQVNSMGPGNHGHELPGSFLNPQRSILAQNKAQNVQRNPSYGTSNMNTQQSILEPVLQSNPNISNRLQLTRQESQKEYPTDFQIEFIYSNQPDHDHYGKKDQEYFAQNDSRHQQFNDFSEAEARANQNFASLKNSRQSPLDRPKNSIPSNGQLQNMQESDNQRSPGGPQDSGGNTFFYDQAQHGQYNPLQIINDLDQGGTDHNEQQENYNYLNNPLL